MSEPQAYTIVRPLLANVPNGRPGWMLTECPYCSCECWKTGLEPDPLPPNAVAACTDCALKRAHHQREMDDELARRRGLAAGSSNMPRFVSDTRAPIDITGFLLPWWIHTNEPVVLLNQNDPMPLLPVFSTEEKLRLAVPWMQLDGQAWKIVLISNGQEFLDQVKDKARVGVDPWITSDGNTRFTAVFLREAAKETGL